MPTLSAPKIIRRIRQRMELSQEALSRALSATKGAIQHWERGRNNPDLARLLALRELCPAGPERKDLDALIKHMQSQVAPLPNGPTKSATPPKGRYAHLYADSGSLRLLRRENTRLQRQVAHLESSLKRKVEQLRIVEELAKDLQREVSELRSKASGGGSAASGGA